MSERITVRASDGRKLEVEHGALEGTPLIFHFGTPCAGRLSDAMLEAGARRGLAHITYSRPGYCSSTRQPGRAVSDCAADVTAIADALGLERFYVAGISGGGPHTLACAALLADRVLAAATIGAIAPQDADGLYWTAGMGEENIEEFGAMEAGEEQLRAYLEAAAAGMVGADGDRMREELGTLVAPADAQALQGAYGDFTALLLSDGVADGIWGWLDDDVAFEKPWGFELAAIDRPVTIWHGAQDMFVPVAHGEWLAARIPGARAVIETDHGHMSRLGLGYGAVLDDLLASA